jgi:hypothetical protein
MFLSLSVQIFGNDSNKSKFDSGGNQGEIEFWQCVLPFGAEPFVLSPAVKKCEG